MIIDNENLKKAIEQEALLRSEGKLSYNNIAELIKPLGFSRVPQYYEMKRKYLFKDWQPEFIYVKAAKFVETIKDAIENGKYGVYIPVSLEGIHAWHGDIAIDYNLCKDLGVQIYELDSHGDTIIGSEKDLSILIIAPTEFGLTDQFINDEIVKFLSEYLVNVSWCGNDILLDGKKICETTLRYLDTATVWTGQFSFADYSEYIELICNKNSAKEPYYIDESRLSKETLEKAFYRWLRTETEDAEDEDTKVEATNKAD